MGRSKHSEVYLGPAVGKVPTGSWPVFRSGAAHARLHLPRKSCRDHFTVLEPQINAQGIHKWPFKATTSLGTWRKRSRPGLAIP